ncbi:chorismate-binding protein [Virgibacillus sp. 179-BFC.A HS]|uniref:Anthranilate synthase component 1 n=1 Tax=Tigheibacillus jepli TaxID=3035914 RepID=A0ABU5CNG2_9BACI|nr:chorismate-binding protein [Virgibacillus sp. 179-BFC.A HS]MDY0406988.1 chorismate-binding protein [Virgibacillus sp. 179-BFC.A HS]
MTNQKEMSTHSYKMEKADTSSSLSEVFRALTGEKKFLMELSQNGKRFSFIGANPYRELIGSQSTSKMIDHINQSCTTYHRHALETLKMELPTKQMDLPFPFFGGAVGYIGYDNGQYVLDIDEELPDELQMPDVHLLFYHNVIVFDHENNHIYLLAVNTDDATNDTLDQRLQPLRDALTASEKHPAVTESEKDIHFTSDISKQEFISKVKIAQAKMQSEGISQIVLSQRMKAAFSGDPFHFYLKLCNANPSPYMYYIDFADYLLLGASPESLLQTNGRQVFSNPIAGTYPRGKNKTADKQLAAKLLADPKELAEHDMLIDLCKRDFSKICHPESIRIPAYMHIEKYEHVMHIVSDVTATLRDDVTGIDALLTCLPAGTVSGEPKKKAMQVINYLEKKKRGVYGGGIGYINFNHDLNFALAIRMLVVKEKIAYLQVGAGIVAASVPEKEYEETLHKAKSLLLAGSSPSH